MTVVRLHPLSQSITAVLWWWVASLVYSVGGLLGSQKQHIFRTNWKQKSVIRMYTFYPERDEVEVNTVDLQNLNDDLNTPANGYTFSLPLQAAMGTLGTENSMQPLLLEQKGKLAEAKGDKAAAEDTLRDELLSHLDELEEGQDVIFKLTLPETANHYRACIDHPRVLKVVALSGGYSREEANRRLGENNDMIASFSRALAEGLSASQSDEEFSQTLGTSIDAIVAASRT